MISIMVRIIKQVLNDKRSLAMIVVAPVFLLTLLYLLLGKNGYTPVVAIKGLPPVMVSALKSQNAIVVVDKDSEESDADFVKNGRATRRSPWRRTAST
jgi:ABC-2 type transport system permease protein